MSVICWLAVVVRGGQQLNPSTVDSSGNFGRHGDRGRRLGLLRVAAAVSAVLLAKLIGALMAQVSV